MLAPTEEQVTLALPLLDRPFDRDPAFRHRQRPVFDGVGRQFVQRHCQRQGDLRGEPYMGTGGVKRSASRSLNGSRALSTISPIAAPSTSSWINSSCAAHPPLRHHRDRQRQLAVQKPELSRKPLPPDPHPRRLTRWVNRDLPRTPPPAHLTVCVVVRGPLLSTTGITAALPKGGVNIGRR